MGDVLTMRTKHFWFLIGLTLSFPIHAPAQDPRPPIIDMHLHAIDFESWGWVQPGQDAGDAFGPVFDQQTTGILAARSTEDLQQKTLAAMDQHNIVFGIVSGPIAESYRRNRPSRLLASPTLYEYDVPINSLRDAFCLAAAR